MLHLLSNRRFEGFDVIQELARARALIVLAYDGVLVARDAQAGTRIGARTRALLRAASLLFPCAVLAGRDPVEVAEQVERVPSLTVHAGHGTAKAEAVERLAAGFPPWPIAYLGSTQDDEPVFRSSIVTHPIRVGPAAESGARFFVNDRDEVDHLLSALVTERARLAGLGAPWHQLDRERKLGGSP